MARAHRVAFLSTFFASLWALVFFQMFSVPGLDPAIVEQIWPVIPWWFLVTFGSYSLWSLGWGLFTFRDCPEAYEELMREISQARDDLSSRGLALD
ncbi:dolichol-phosphate mannosyltransferase subunit 3 [Roridomyces roridus]|uniref:Dolichol-phosphate mannosyltransferase subunit 3 n=1 Tax=Roridomyces roridus TaxID=1738132 RepID=A0AAD7FFJ4_9AGAR|nr:dolichol-phosphate mannosyltransferase subunit 3 [Roridomyces roridus]